MVRKQGLPDDSIQPEQQRSTAADADVWTQLGALASSQESDPVLRLLVSEAVTKYEELRGITATIASRYRALVDAIPDGVIIHDESGNVLDANEASCRLYGQERESILHSSMLVLNPGLDSEFLATLHEKQNYEHGLTASTTVLREDGTTSALELHAREYLDTGRIRIIVVVRDLGPREVAMQQLHDSESWLRRLIRQVDKGFIVWSRRGQILSANPAACRILQMSELELRELSPDQLERWQFLDVTGSARMRSDVPWFNAMETGRPQESSICGIQLPNAASTLWISVSAVPQLRLNSAEVEMAACLFSEVTQLQRDAWMFAQSQALNKVATWELHFDTQSMHCSAQMHSILDLPLITPLSRERLLGHFQGGDLDRFRQALATLPECGFDLFEALMTTSIGRKRRVRVRLRPLIKDGITSGIFGTLKDITAESPDITI